MAETQEYSPLNSNPYQPNLAPPTPEAKPSPLQDSPGFQFQGHGNISHGGAIAGMFDTVLRGTVNGFAMGEAHKALTLKKKSDDLNASYNADAQRLYQMKQSGVDEKSPEYQAARSAVDGSWGALQDFRGGLIDQQQSGGKKKPAKGAKTGQDDPMMALSNPAASPQEKAAALYAISKKLGPPVYGQIAALNTPQAQQARATQQTGADTSQATGETNNKLATMANQIATLSTKEHLTPEEETQLGDLKKRYTDLNATLHPQKVPTSGGLKRYRKDAKGNTLEYQVDAQGNEIPDTERPLSTAQAPKPVRAWTKDKSGKFTSVMVDPTTNQIVPGSENGDIAPPASLSGHITTGDFHWVDSEGNQHSTTETHTTTPMAAASGKSSSPETPAKSVNPPTVVTQSFHGKTVPGMVAKGNVDVANRPNIDNGDGTHSSVFSMSFGTDKGEVLVPGVGDGTTYPLRKLTNEEALDQYKKTGKNLGTFKDAKTANAYAEILHKDQEKQPGTPKPENTTRRERVRTPAAPPAPAAALATPGDRILGHKGGPEERKAKENADNLELAASQSLQRMKKPTPIGDTGIVFNWVRAQVAGAGRMTNTEIQQAIQSGSMGTKFKNAYDRATTGKLDPTFRREMVDDTLMSARQARIVANSYKPKTGGTVKLKAPNGQMQDVAPDQVEHYKSLGAVIVPNA